VLMSTGIEKTAVEGSGCNISLLLGRGDRGQGRRKGPTLLSKEEKTNYTGRKIAPFADWKCARPGGKEQVHQVMNMGGRTAERGKKKRIKSKTANTTWGRHRRPVIAQFSRIMDASLAEKINNNKRRRGRDHLLLEENRGVEALKIHPFGWLSKRWVGLLVSGCVQGMEQGRLNLGGA